jgi:DNA replication protein DnaD
MVEDGLEDLKDETIFARIGVTIRRVEEKLKNMMAREVITKQMRHFLSAKNTTARRMKVNRKVHKKVLQNGISSKEKGEGERGEE